MPDTGLSVGTGILVDMEITQVLGVVAVLVVGVLLGALLGWLAARTRPDAVAGLVGQSEVMQGLDRLSDQVLELDRERATWQGEFRQRVGELHHETRSLATALRRPQVRGRWGELHLRRAVELAGLVDRCDFTEQVSVDDADGGTRRPDLVVHLVGGRSLVVDAKAPLDAYLDATDAATDAATDDADAREVALARHARQLRTHVDQLGAKAYWRAFAETPEFVVLFVPAESILAAALEADAGLLDHAADRKVVLASPTTLIALLRTVAHGWRHEALAEQAGEIHRLGRDLHDRLAVFGGHLDRVGRSLGAAVTSYNQAVGSLEARVLVSARRLGDLEVSDQPLPSPRQVEAGPRSVAGADPDALSGSDPARGGAPGPGGHGPGLHAVDRRAASGPR